MGGDRLTSSADVETFFDEWIGHSNARRWDHVASMMHPDVVYADPMAAEPARGRAAAVARAQQQYAPFPDGVVELVGAPFVATAGSELAYRWRFSGTHERPVVPPGFAATGLRVTVEGASVLQLADGLVIAGTLYFDATDVARQLLAAPPAGSPLERVVAWAQRVRVRVRDVRRRGGREPSGSPTPGR
jgi:predicted ester cyclase